MNYVIMFFVMVFFLMTWSSEAERDVTISIGEYWNGIARLNTELGNVKDVTLNMGLGIDTTVRVECTDWEKIAKSATEGMNFKEGMEVVDSLWQVIQRINSEWELIRYEGDIGIDYGDSIMVKKK